MAQTLTTKEVEEGEQIAHHRSVKRDREEVTRVKLECRVNEKVVGFSIDGVDTHKWSMPTTKSQANVLKGLSQTHQKQNNGSTILGQGPQSFPVRYRSLSTVSTGGNMTIIIIADLFNKRMFDKAEEIYINWDGSADNVNYTCLFGFVHLRGKGRMAPPVDTDFAVPR